MQPKPFGWPVAGAVEVAPEVFLVLPGSSWPPSDGAAPTGTAVVGSWSVDRELTGSSLPGQVRGGTGFSIASGSATFAQPKGAPLVPWGRGAQAIGPGGKARLVASYAGPAGAGLQLGSFVVQPITGANNENTVTVELAEDSLSLRKPVTIPTVLAEPASWLGSASPVEAAWVLDQAARAGGFRQVPDPVPSAIWAAPCTGSPYLAVGTTTVGPNMWTEVDGAIGWVIAGNSQFIGSATRDIPDEVYLTFDRAGGGQVVTLMRGVYFIFSTSGVEANAGGNIGSAAYPAPLPAGWGRVQANIDFRGKRVRVRVAGSAWSEWAAFTGTLDTVNEPATVQIYGGGSITIRGVQVHTADDNRVWAAPTARIAPTRSLLEAVIVPDARDGWSLIQDITAATLGAAWVDEKGVFNYRGRDKLRGVGAPVETIEALDSVESLRWRVDPADVADRVTVTYTPADIQRVNDSSLTVWEATEAVEVKARKTVTLYADFEGAVGRLAAWVPLWNPTGPDAITYPAHRMSRWAAATSRDGGGPQPADTALSISAVMVSPSRARIQITNTTGQTLWTVTGTGEPTLTLRANMVAQMGEPRTLASGKPADAALAPLDIDLGVWVQDDDTAQQVLAWAAGQTATAQATIEQVRVAPDLSRQLGDVIRLRDEATGLATKALITGVHLSGDDGPYAQTLDLALLAVTFDDLDKALAGLTFAQIDALWAGKTFADIDNWILDLGGTL